MTNYLPGGSLEDKLQAHEVFSNQKVLHFAIQLLDALHYIHKHKKEFIHRDIKPGNILFEEDGTLVLSDFGIVKTLAGGHDLTPLDHAIGTRDYMAPELLLPKPAKATPQSDLYSVGVVLYQMLTGGTHPLSERIGLISPQTQIRSVPRRIRSLIRQPLSNSGYCA